MPKKRLKLSVLLLISCCLLQPLMAQYVMQLDSVQAFPANQVFVGIQIHNASPVTSFQCDIPLPGAATAEVGSVVVNANRAVDHLIVASIIQDSILRILCFSLNNTPFNGNTGEIARFKLTLPAETMEASLPLLNALIANTSGQNVLTSTIAGGLKVMGPLNVNISSNTGTVCAGQSVTMTAVVSGGGWNPTYVWTSEPSGLNGGQASLTFAPQASINCIVHVNDGFQNASDNIFIETVAPPVAIAGENITQCYGFGVSLTGSMQHAQYSSWSGGNGFFEDVGALQTIYHPSEADLAEGSVGLVLTASGANTCPEHSDTLQLTLKAPVTLDAGVNAVVPYQTVYTNYDAMAFHYSMLQWESRGDGTFSDTGNLHCSYTPGENDLEAGSTWLLLTAYGNSNCPSVTDSLQLIVLSEDDNIMLLPTLEAGVSDTVTLDILVNNRTLIRAMETSIILPAGMTWLEETASLTERAQDHITDIQFNGNELQLTAYSQNGNPFLGTEGSVFHIAFQTGSQTGTFPLPLMQSALYDTNGMDVLTDYFDGIIQVLLTNTYEMQESQHELSARLQPMPVSEESHLQIELHSSAELQLTAFDITGRQLMEMNLGNLTKGSHSIPLIHKINTADSHIRIMLLRFSLSDGTKTYKTIKYF